VDDSGSETAFDDLLAANAAYAAHFTDGDFDGIAHAGIAIVTCMDSRIDPLRMLGLEHGDAKIFRNPGGRVTPEALEALVLGVHLLNVDRILVIPHTRCAMTANTEEELREQIGRSAGLDATWQEFHVVDDQLGALREDVARVRSHPLIPATVRVGGFMYDVDTGRIEPTV
jgi:carbonic anhydrase